jgi:hypothetical protein
MPMTATVTQERRPHVRTYERGAGAQAIFLEDWFH